MKRRGFLLGAAAATAGLIVSPHIIRVADLMPIRPLATETYGPDGFLTMAMITDEYARQLDFAGAKGALLLPYGWSLRQSSVDFVITGRDMRMSIEAFSDRVLRPAASSMARHLSGARIRGTPPPLRSGMLGAIASSRLGVRGIQEYSIAADKLMVRMDVLHA